MVTRTLVAILAGCLSVAAASAADRTAPRALGAPPESTDNCYRIHGRSGEVAGEAKVSVSVAADGRVTILMPHPERVHRSVQMSWRPRAWGDSSPWMRLFRNARAWVG